jgi:hypothetical protein
MVLAEATSWAAEATASKAVATQLYEDAKTLFKKGDLAPACEKFAESQRLDPQLGTLLRLAACYEKIGKTASAWASFKDAVAIASQRHDSREAAARAAAERLESRVCKLTIVVDAGAPPDLGVSSNGNSIGRALFGSPMPVDPGDYLLMAKAEGFEDWTQKIVIASGTPETRVAVPALVRHKAPPPAVAVATPIQPVVASPVLPPPPATTVQSLPQPQPQEPSDPGRTRRMVGYALGAAGVVGLGVGVGFGLAKQAKQSDRDSANSCSTTSSCTLADKDKVDRLTDEAKTRATVANVGFIAGGAALAAGTILVVTAWPKSTPSTSAQVQPWISDQAAGLVVGGSW